MLNRYSAEKLKQDIDSAKAKGAEFCICYIHFLSKEYTHEVISRQEQTAKEIAEAGADCIMGSHAHAIQRYDRVVTDSGRIVPVVYSLGNFITSDITSMITRKSIIYELVLSRKENGSVFVSDEKYIPCRVVEATERSAFTVFPTPAFWRNGKESKFFSECEQEIKAVIGSQIEIDNHQTMRIGGGGAFDDAGNLLSTKHNIAISNLTKQSVCQVLGFPIPKDNESYTSLNFAMDARKDGIAIISEITSDPKYVTSKTKCSELADIAITKGAKLLISTCQIKDYPCLVVENVFNAYCAIIQSIRSSFSPKVVSITGSIGKTTTTEMTRTVLSSKFNTHFNTGSANNVRYVGSVIQQLKPEHQVYVQETMEGPPFGAASTISKMLHPDAAIVTVVGSSHMEIFGSQERILESCLGVQDGMPDDGILILNGDDPFQASAKCKRKVVYYGIQNEKADYRAVDIHGEGDLLCFNVKHDNTLTPIRLHCFGHHNILDALAAFAAGKWAGMTDSEVAAGLEKYRTSGIRQNMVSYGGYRLFLDCYNAAPESVRSALDSLRLIPRSKNGRKIAVLADIKEIGNKDEEFHRKVGQMAADAEIDLLICYGASAKWIAEESKRSKRFPVYHTDDFEELLFLMREHIHRGDVTLLKGSHSMELEFAVDRVFGTWFHEEFERYDFKTKIVSDNDLKYCIYTDHATVKSKLSYKTELIIPDHIEGVPVTSIGDEAFNKTFFTKEVTLPPTLKNIRYCAFYKANKIQEITIPSSVLIIDKNAFSTCENLKSVTIEEGCMHLGYRAFGNCRKLESILIPASVQQIDSEAFINCSKLTIYGVAGSYAEGYSRKEGIRFVDINSRHSIDK